MSENERPIVEEILDYAVYAPLGLALTVLEDLPKLVERGKGALSSQVGVAKFAGKLAFGQLRKTIDDALKPSGPIVTDASGYDGPPSAPAADKGARRSAAPGRNAHGPTTGSSGSTAGDLAIPGYDTLAASQVVSRLDALDHIELDEVRVYETGHRGRRTILARIDQLERERHVG